MHNIYFLGLSGEHRCPLGYLFLTFGWSRKPITICKKLTKVCFIDKDLFFQYVLRLHFTRAGLFLSETQLF